MAMSGCMVNEAPSGASAVLMSGVMEELASPGRAKMEFCTRELATHVGGAGVCGCIAPLSAIRVVGRVDWNPEHIESERRHALALAASRELVL